MPMTVFKRMVRGICDSKENIRFNITCALYKSLPLYSKCISKIQMWPWWIFTDANPSDLVRVRCLYRLLVGQSCINVDTAKYDNKSSICTLCDMNVPETVTHLFFECSFFQECRVTLWDNVIASMPPAMVQEVEMMSGTQKTEFIASGFYCDYTAEWQNIYYAVIHFCYSIYSERRLL